MNDGLVRLSCKDMGRTCCQPIDRGRALFEGRLDRKSWLQFVDIDANILRNGGIGSLGLSPNRRDEAFGQHGASGVVQELKAVLEESSGGLELGDWDFESRAWKGEL